jgi:hypothetical protein
VAALVAADTHPMEEGRLFERDPLGAAFAGVVFGTTVGLLEWWAPIWHHVTTYAVVVGVGYGSVTTRLVYRRGVEPQLALLLLAGVAIASALVFG